MNLKIHNAYRVIVALSDSELIGKTFEEGIRQIIIRPNFFQGDEKSREENADAAHHDQQSFGACVLQMFLLVVFDLIFWAQFYSRL